MKFLDLPLDKRIIQAIDELGYTTPTPIQIQAIPPALEGRDILGTAQTGTGKTCAFAVPILHRLENNVQISIHNAQLKGKSNKRPLRALILTPTRELAIQIDESFEKYGRFMPLKTGLVMGGVSAVNQIKSMTGGVDILTATPGRFIDLVWQGHIDPTTVEIFVLDEADRMLDMGFLPDVKRVVEFLPKVRQTLFFSATMPPEVKKLTDTLLINPVRVAVAPVSATADRIEQWVMMTDKVNKIELLAWALKQIPPRSSTLVFTRTKHGADKLCRKLTLVGIRCRAIHGDKSQGARQDALDCFKQGKVGVLVATDIAARGIDIDGIAYVFNFELPNEPETYVHRIGRTGRAGREGVAVSLCDIDETKYLADIEKLIGKKVPVEQNHPYTMKNFEPTKKEAKKARPPRRRK